jgi:hypothetical protein
MENRHLCLDKQLFSLGFFRNTIISLVAKHELARFDLLLQRGTSSLGFCSMHHFTGIQFLFY